MSSRTPTDGEKVPLWRRLTALVIGLGVLGAIVLAGDRLLARLQRPDVMPLSRVVVDGGLEHLRRDQLEEVVTQAVSGNYFTVDIEAVRRAAGSLEWVEDASVKRVWPNALVIDVRERRAFARWGESALVNRAGEVFRPSSLDGVGELPLLEGPDERGSEVVGRFVQLESVFRNAGYGRLERLRLDARGGWSLWLEGGLNIVLGKEAVEPRLARVLGVLRTLGSDAQRLETIDARYANGMAVRWKQNEITEPETATAVAG